MIKSYTKIKTPGGDRPLTDLEKCLLLILRKKDNITSLQVLKMAKKIKLCAACSDRSEVFYVGEKLIRRGLINKKLESKEYFWSFTDLGKSYSEEI